MAPIPNAYIKVCEQAGGKIRLNEKVIKIIIEHNTVRGIETDKGYFPADIIVSNAGVVKTMELAGEQYFPVDYIGRAKSAKDSFGACTVKYVLNAPLADTPGTLYIPKGYILPKFLKDAGKGKIPDDTSLFVISPTVSDPTLAPKGLHLLLGAASSPSDMLDKDINNKVLDLVENTMERIYPGLKKHTLYKQRQGVDYIAAVGGRGRGEGIGMAQRFDQDGKLRFSPKSPVKGLYIVGADTGAFGIGTELAAQSAMDAKDIIMKDLDAIAN